MIPPHSTKRVQWFCNQCPVGARHIWQAQVHSRTQGSSCPYCAGRAICQHNSLATQAPGVASEWDSDANNLTPSDFTTGSSAMVGWKCSTCKHAWWTTIKHRTCGTVCPHCADLKRAMRKRQPTLAASGEMVMRFWDAEQNAQSNLDATRLSVLWD